jgi:hypothetical protein
MTAPVRSHIGEGLESMRDPVVEFSFVLVYFCVGLRDTFCHNLRVTLLVTSVFAVGALHTSSILEKLSTESATHDVVELLLHKLVPVLFVYFFFSFTNGTFTAKSHIEGLLVCGVFY